MLASTTSFATTYAVWPVAGEGETQIPNEFNPWWNLSSEVVNYYDMQVTQCRATNYGANASAGWITYSTADFDFTQLADKDLVFDAMIRGTGEWHIRLTRPDNDAVVSVPDDGEFHQVRFNIKEVFPAVAETWASGAANGTDIFTFAVVGSDLRLDAMFFFTNVRYVDALEMPTITTDVTDVTYNSAVLNWNVNFPAEYENTTVTLNGETVSETGNRTLTDLEPNTVYEYTIIATGEINGTTIEKTATVTVKTLREPGKKPVWYGTTDKPGFTADYNIVYNDDKTLTVNAIIETEKDTPTADRNFHIFIGGNEWLKLYDDGTGTLTGTTTSTFEEDTSITWEWYLPYAGGVYQEQNVYVVGSANEPPLSVKIKASVENVTFESAEIHYTVTAPEAYKVYYTLNGNEAVEATESPILLQGLDEQTEYTCEVYAVMGEGDDAVESRHATLTFKTPAEDAIDLVYSALTAAEFKNAFRIGETEDMRRSFFVTLPWEVVYRAEGTAVYSVDLSEVENLVGMVPQIYWNGFKSLTKNAATGRYEYEFGAQELDGGVAISHYFAYSGGVVDIRTPYTTWGMENEAPQIGEAVNLTLTASKKGVKVNEPVLLAVSAKDANNYYLPADDIQFEVEGGAYILEFPKFQVSEVKGERTITAKSGNLTASVTVTAIASPEADNVLAGAKGTTDDNVMAGSVDNVTDDNLQSELVWNCSETDEHYLIYELEEGKYIEGIDLLFEGAYATEFTITLSNNTPEELSTVATQATEATEDVVFTPQSNNTQHYFYNDPTGTHKYVTLRTQKALNSGWGIKVRDLKLYATDDKPTTGVESIAIDNNLTDSTAPVEYYDLNGRRVANPSTGLYIRRQGNTVSKVVIK